jgi:pimeloyl-ACP methyl ester carboxylesterase
VYESEFARTGFQGGLNWYRAALSVTALSDLRLYSGARIEVPATFLAGSRDWGMYQSPGALEAMAEKACGHFRGCHTVAGAGHWVQQEQPDRVVGLLLDAMADV